jgi:hypothetical protein
MSSIITIYSPFASNRLTYVLDWIFKTRLGISYALTHNVADINTDTNCIVYGSFNKGVVSIPSSALLQQVTIQQHEIKTGAWKDLPTLYANEDVNYTLPFDFFSAVFFLLSRYEEYFPFVADKHGRYPATDSILYKNNLLEQPIIDEWIHQLRIVLIQKGILVTEPQFSFLPTYDIDIAWSYKNKGLKRSIGGFVKDIISGRIGSAISRLTSFTTADKDPYYSFESITTLHKKYNYTPIYFVLAALQTGEFDKNISPLHPAMKQLIQQFSHEGILGVHPSYNMNTSLQLLNNEKSTLEKIGGITITQSRQHYIRLWFPLTYRQLIAAGINDDYSMGYGTHLGFRAGTGSTFRWYDLEKEETTNLYVHPFCFMDSTAHYELNLEAEDAFKKLEKMSAILKNTNSTLVSVFHNFSLGTDTEWKGWSEAYAGFLKRMAKQN